MMVDNKDKNYGRSNNWCSQDGINQKYFGCSDKIRTRVHRRLKREILLIDLPHTNLVSAGAGTPHLNALQVTGIIIGSFIGIIIIICCLFLFTRKRSNSSESREEEGKGDLPASPRILIVKHNHAAPELCTTPDTQPILDYYSSKAGLTNNTSDPINNSKNDDHKSIPVEVSENVEKSSEENIDNNNGYVPQYYNGMEIPPLGARIIPLERQVQIAKELTSPNANNKRKSSRLSISSILSISSRRKSSSTTNTVTNNNCNNSNSSITNTLSLIRETPPKENDNYYK